MAITRPRVHGNCRKGKRVHGAGGMLEVKDRSMKFCSTLGVPKHEFRLVLGRTKIDYDLNKDKANREKHKYALESAVWLLEKLLLPSGTPLPYAVSDSFVVNTEVRHMHMCVDDHGDVVLMVTTMRDDETVRIISLRRAHDSERAIFRDITGPTNNHLI